MKKYINLLLILSSLLFWGCKTASQSELIGKVSFNDWKNSSYWNEESYLFYTVDVNKAEILASKMDSVNILYIFASPYCGTCLIEIPRIYKILEALPRNAEKFKLFVMDEYNTEPTKTYKIFGINTTPTFIAVFYSNKSIKFSPKFDVLTDLIENIQ